MYRFEFILREYLCKIIITDEILKVLKTYESAPTFIEILGHGFQGISSYGNSIIPNVINMSFGTSVAAWILAGMIYNGKDKFDIDMIVECVKKMVLDVEIQIMDSVTSEIETFAKDIFQPIRDKLRIELDKELLSKMRKLVSTETGRSESEFNDYTLRDLVCKIIIENKDDTELVSGDTF